MSHVVYERRGRVAYVILDRLQTASRPRKRAVRTNSTKLSGSSPKTIMGCRVVTRYIQHLSETFVSFFKRHFVEAPPAVVN